MNVNDFLDRHVALDPECLDRIYLNAYVPNQQVSGQVVTFSRWVLVAAVHAPGEVSRTLVFDAPRRGRVFFEAVVADHVPTPDGAPTAIVYTKLHGRLLGPLLTADRPPASRELRRALKVIDTSVSDYIRRARIRPAE